MWMNTDPRKVRRPDTTFVVSDGKDAYTASVYRTELGLGVALDGWLEDKPSEYRGEKVDTITERCEWPDGWYWTWLPGVVRGIHYDSIIVDEAKDYSEIQKFLDMLPQTDDPALKKLGEAMAVSARHMLRVPGEIARKFKGETVVKGDRLDAAGLTKAERIEIFGEPVSDALEDEDEYKGGCYEITKKGE